MSCPHPENRLVHDEREGVITCAECAFVVQDVLFSDSQSKEKQFDDKIEIEMGKVDRSYNFIKDCCTNLNAPKSIEDYATWYLSTLKHDQRYQSFRVFDLAAYAVYESLHRYEVPRTYKEVEAASGVSSKKLWDIEAKACVKIRSALPHDYADRFCSYLKIEYGHISKIKDLCQCLYGLNNHSPQSLCAATIFFYSKKHDLDVPLRLICEISGVASSTIRQIAKKKLQYLHVL